MKRQIILDTETTGLSVDYGHRLIEVGCLEMVNRRLTGRTFHHYINPGRTIEAGATKVHGISNDFLVDKPYFREIALSLFEFIQDAELIIHNAPFDVGFLNAEFLHIDKKYSPITHHCEVFDTLAFARKMHPGQQNSLDALCKRYSIDNNHRTLHGALLDAELLAEVYLRMTGGQTQLFASEVEESVSIVGTVTPISFNITLPVIHANEDERIAHQTFCETYEIIA